MAKKRHCVKNVLISGDDQKVLYLSPTYSGSVHDKAIADEQDFQFQRTIDLLQDTGFQGLKPKNANIIAVRHNGLMPPCTIML